MIRFITSSSSRLRCYFAELSQLLLIGLSTGGLVVRLAGRPVGRSAGGPVNPSAGRPLSLSAGRPVGRLAGRPLGRPIGQSAKLEIPTPPNYNISKCSKFAKLLKTMLLGRIRRLFFFFPESSRPGESFGGVGRFPPIFFKKQKNIHKQNYPPTSKSYPV